MGCYDIVIVPCPSCGKPYEAQSKGGDCTLTDYTLDEAPPDVLSDVNRHAPFTCACGDRFEVARGGRPVAVSLMPRTWSAGVSNLDSMIGRLDRLLSEFLVAAEAELDEADRQTMRHHADDLIGVGNAALKKLAKEKVS